MLIAKQLRWLGRRAVIPSARKYRVRWLGFHPAQDTWQPRSSLVHDVPDVIRAYELMDSSNPDMLANVNALVVNDNDKMTYDVKNENDVKVENIVAARFHQDHENETLIRSARRHGQANKSPPYTEPTECGFVV